jgi:radical SAM protein with 4Fe4S-binding SPASM domain
VHDWLDYEGCESCEMRRWCAGDCACENMLESAVEEARQDWYQAWFEYVGED